MSQRIDQFCENLRQKLTTAENGLEALKAKIGAKAAHIKDDVQSHLDGVRDRIERDRANVAAANAEAIGWLDQRASLTKEKIAEWKAKRDGARLRGRADGAERYAAATIDVAIAAIDEAEQAALEAWLARREADAAEDVRSPAA